MIYVLAEVDPLDGEVSRYVKIGYADANGASVDDALRRVNELQCGNPRKLLVIGLAEGSLRDEQSLHARFTDHRVRLMRLAHADGVRDTEWFVSHGALADWVDSVRIEHADTWAAAIVRVGHGCGTAGIHKASALATTRAAELSTRAALLKRQAADEEIETRTRAAAAHFAFKATSHAAQESLRAARAAQTTPTSPPQAPPICGWCHKRGHITSGCGLKAMWKQNRAADR